MSTLKKLVFLIFILFFTTLAVSEEPKSDTKHEHHHGTLLGKLEGKLKHLHNHGKHKHANNKLLYPPTLCEVYCYTPTPIAGPILAPGPIQQQGPILSPGPIPSPIPIQNPPSPVILPTATNNSNGATIIVSQTPENTTPKSTDAPQITTVSSSVVNKSESSRIHHNALIFHERKLHISKETHERLIKEYHTRKHAQKRKSFKYREFPDSCHVICRPVFIGGPGPVILPPAATENPSSEAGEVDISTPANQGSPGTTTDSDQEDPYVEGEDKPIEYTVPPRPHIQVINGIRPVDGVDFTGLSDFGPDGNPSRDPSVPIEETYYEEKNNKGSKRKNRLHPHAHSKQHKESY